MNIHQRAELEWIITTLALSLIAQIAISWKLWVPFGRQFPLISLWAWLPLDMGPATDMVLALLVLASLVGIIILPFSRPLIGLFLLSATLLVLEDVMRLQPWLFLFGVMFLAVAVYGPGRRDSILAAFMLVTSATYFWSGVQKLNHAFAVEILPWLADGLGLKGFVASAPGLAIGAAGIEIAIGLGLLVGPTRKAAAVAGMAMHGVLLATLGPWSLDWNRVIWPWNIAMGIVLWLLAFRAPTGPDRNNSGALFRPIVTSLFFWLVAVVVALLPLLNYFRLWDSHLSGSLYSGNNSEAIFFYDLGDSSRLPSAARPFTYYYPGTREEFILIDNWAIGELEAPFYPEERYFRRVGAWLCGHLADRSKGGIRISVKEKFSSTETLKECRCGELP